MIYTKQEKDEWNEIVAIVVEAMLGVISPNFRQIKITKFDKIFHLDFILEEESKIDREEILDRISTIDDFHLRPKVIDHSIKVDSKVLIYPLNQDNVRLIYWRRE